MRFIAGSMLAIIVLVACVSGESPRILPTPIGSSEGHRLFITKGCAACHGSRQEGSAIAPNIAGYSADRVERQVRAPLGAMPIFPPNKISNQELGAISQYIESLERGDVFVKSDVLLQESFQQHWLILLTLAEGSPEEAIQHTDGVIGMVTGPHQSQMNQIRIDIETGDLHSAVHSIEDMLTGVEESDSEFLDIRIRLTRNFAQAGDAATAAHYLQHITLTLDASNVPLTERIASIQKNLEAGNLSPAVRELEALIEQ